MLCIVIQKETHIALQIHTPLCRKGNVLMITLKETIKETLVVVFACYIRVQGLILSRGRRMYNLLHYVGSCDTTRAQPNFAKGPTQVQFFTIQGDSERVKGTLILP